MQTIKKRKLLSLLRQYKLTQSSKVFKKIFKLIYVYRNDKKENDVVTLHIKPISKGLINVYYIFKKTKNDNVIQCRMQFIQLLSKTLKLYLKALNVNINKNSCDMSCQIPDELGFDSTISQLVKLTNKVTTYRL